jgi:hypothetical protein
VKSLVPITMDAIAGSVVRAGLATEQEVAATVAELEAFAARDETILGVPRIVQAWGRRSGTSRTSWATSWQESRTHSQHDHSG